MLTRQCRSNVNTYFVRKFYSETRVFEIKFHTYNLSVFRLFEGFTRAI